VTNTNSSGSGSLANCIGSNRTIKFTTSGTIVGRFDLTNVTYLTIDGTTAPPPGITIDNDNNGDGISFDGPGTHHDILKGVRVVNAGNDGINVVSGAHDILITNVASYDNRDGNIDVAGDNSNDSYNVTVQYSILGRGKPVWSGSMLITGKSVSVHHNLFSPSTANGVGERNPFVHANYSPVGAPNADIRNNLVWKWGRNDGSGSGYGTAVAFNATANVANNYYYSIASADSAVNRDTGYGEGRTGKIFAIGNLSGNGIDANSENNVAEYPILQWAKVTTQSACAAARAVLEKAGTKYRDTVEQGLITDASSIPGC
jgi:hypothetical protein